ncbi:MAG: hypothetical protein H5T64_07345 [Chloroflexi bacterium]|nr:hypothetical protein [Chloroflexota bacterium]
MAGLGEIEKLRLLLPHWIEHNAEHAAEFREWAERAQRVNQGDAARNMHLAAESLEEANRALSTALEKLGGVPTKSKGAHDI